MGDYYFISFTYSEGMFENYTAWGIRDIDYPGTNPFDVAKSVIKSTNEHVDLNSVKIHITAFNRVYCYDEPKQGFFSRVFNKLKGG